MIYLTIENKVKRTTIDTSGPCFIPCWSTSDFSHGCTDGSVLNQLRFSLPKVSTTMTSASTAQHRGGFNDPGATHNQGEKANE